MKRLLIIFLVIGNLCNAQNYQCLRAGVKHYFINANGYLRGITIDSVSKLGDAIIYYPFHTPRGSYDVTGTSQLSLDSNGGSWLGKKVKQSSDGTFVFDGYWNDSVVIKTQANIGDSWVFYSDTSGLRYKATLVSKDTMTVLSSPDSVEKIMINAYNGLDRVTSDSLDNFTIILSKNNGFVQVFDLFMFPYHEPGATYKPGMDFFLDRSTCNYYDVNFARGFSPSRNITLFKLINFINPNDQQLHNWNVGDMIENYHSFANFPVTSDWDSGITYYDYILETVTNKIVSGHKISYTLTGDNYVCGYYTDPCYIIDNARRYSFYDTAFSIADSAFIPEENVYENYIFYFPNDASDCLLTPEYVKVEAGYYVVHPADPRIYKLGIGLTYFEFIDPGDLIWEYDGLVYTKLNGISCGTLSVNNVTAQESDQIDLYPNPASKELNVTATDKIMTLAISNVSGETVFTKEYNAKHKHVKVDVAELPAGVYLVTVNESDMRKFVKE